jgi:hypothetical protein
MAVWLPVLGQAILALFISGVLLAGTRAPFMAIRAVSTAGDG